VLKRLKFFPGSVAQNHRIVEVGRDLQSSSGPTSLLKQGHLKLVSQDCVQTDFEYLQIRTLHSLSGQPVPALSHPHGKRKKISIFLCLDGLSCALILASSL